MEDALIEWEAAEFKYHKNSTDWYWGVGVIGLGIAITSIILNNLLFGMLIVIGTVSLLLQSIKKPRRVVFAIGERGIRVGKTLYPYSSLDSFWITDDESPRLLLKSQKVLMPLITIPIGDVGPGEIRDILLELLEEEEQQEPLAQHIMERLGF